MLGDIKVSIICIVYNHEKYIEKALNGFLMQKVNFNYEILIHEDASTDNSSNILKKYENKYRDKIKVIYQKENKYSKGISPSKPLYEMAQGKYLAICEGDDYWIDENKLQKQVDFLEKNLEYVATYHNVFVVDSKGEKLKNDLEWPIKKSHTINIIDLEKNIYLCGQTASIVCRNFWRGWNQIEKDKYLKCRANGDRKLSIIFTLMGKVYFFKEIMSSYRKVTSHGDSYTARIRGKNRTFHMYNSLIDLQKLALELFDYDYKIDVHLKDCFYYALVFMMKNPNKKNFQIFIKILKIYKNKLEIIIYSVNRLFKLLVRKIKGCFKRKKMELLNAK